MRLAKRWQKPCNAAGVGYKHWIKGYDRANRASTAVLPTTNNTIVPGGVIGKTDAVGGTITDYGWSPGRAIYMEDVACTIYSAMGIDWTKKVEETPSGRAFHFVETASGTSYVDFQPINELFA